MCVSEELYDRSLLLLVDKRALSFRCCLFINDLIRWAHDARFYLRWGEGAETKNRNREVAEILMVFVIIL